MTFTIQPRPRNDGVTLASDALSFPMWYGTAAHAIGYTTFRAGNKSARIDHSSFALTPERLTSLIVHMKILLALLMCLVLGISECFAIKGGPNYGGAGNLIGRYAGVMHGP